MARDTRRSFRELERELEDLERSPPPRPERETSTPEQSALERLKVAYGNALGHWKYSAHQPPEYEHAIDWLIGSRDRDDFPPVPTAEVREALINALRGNTMYDLYEIFYDIEEVYGDREPFGYPTPEERERMNERLENHGVDGQ